MRKIIDKVKNIRNKPEGDKIKIMWFLVAFFMVVAVGIGLLEFLNKKSSIEKLVAIDPLTFPAFTKTAESLEKLNEEVELLATEAEKVEMENIAKKYIEENKSLKGGSFEDLKLERIEKYSGNWYLNYKQYYKDIPVEKSNIGLTIDNSAKIVTSSGFDYYPEIELDVMPIISAEEAFEIVKKEAKINNLSLDSSSLIIYSDISEKQVKNYLAWKLNVMSSEPMYDHNYFVGARNGNIITHYSMIKE